MVRGRSRAGPRAGLPCAGPPSRVRRVSPPRRPRLVEEGATCGAARLDHAVELVELEQTDAGWLLRDPSSNGVLLAP